MSGRMDEHVSPTIMNLRPRDLYQQKHNGTGTGTTGANTLMYFESLPYFLIHRRTM